MELASDESCGKAVAKLERHHPGVEMERTTALRLLHEHGPYARDFIDDLLALRMVKANGWWDEYWETRRRAWRKRAEDFAEPRRDLAA